MRLIRIVKSMDARQFPQERLPAPAQEIGRVWQGDYDIDVAGRLLDGSMLYGECKWWRQLASGRPRARSSKRSPISRD